MLKKKDSGYTPEVPREFLMPPLPSHTNTLWCNQCGAIKEVGSTRWKKPEQTKHTGRCARCAQITKENQ